MLGLSTCRRGLFFIQKSSYAWLVMVATRPNDVPVPTRDIEQAKADIAHAGYGILEGALDEATTRAIRDRLLDQATAERERRVDVSNSAVEPDDDVNQWVTMLPNKGAVFRALINNDNCLGLVRSVLGDDAILSEFSAHITWPGNKEMALHTDQWFMPQPALPGEHHSPVSDISRAVQPFGGPEPATWAINAPVVTNAMWAITDFTRENGATRLVPKSHLSGNHPAPDTDYDCVFAEAPAGSLVVWEGRTWHAASLNTGTTPRMGITTHWCAPFMRQLLNFTYGLRPDVADDLSEHERSVMGFRVWSTYGATGDFNADWATPGAENLGELTADDET